VLAAERGDGRTGSMLVQRTDDLLCVNQLARMLSSLERLPVQDSHFRWTSFRGRVNKVK
jgi:hypothetical protein